MRYVLGILGAIVLAAGGVAAIVILLMAFSWGFLNWLPNDVKFCIFVLSVIGVIASVYFLLQRAFDARL